MSSVIDTVGGGLAAFIIAFVFGWQVRKAVQKLQFQIDILTARLTSLEKRDNIRLIAGWYAQSDAITDLPQPRRREKDGE